MGFYGKINEDYLTDTSLIIVDESSFDELMDLMKKWKTSNENNLKKTYKSNSLSKEEYEDLKKVIEELHTLENYNQYKKKFDYLCKFIGISPDGVVITKCKLTEGSKEDNSSLEVIYTSNTKKISLPEDIKLYHMSKTPGIDALNPQFRARGKSEDGYLCSSPRVYFTIFKNMPKVMADYKPTDKLTYYEAKQRITEVYVDPIVWVKAMGAVYVETKTPIPVRVVNRKEKAPDPQEKGLKEIINHQAKQNSMENKKGLTNVKL